MYINKITLKHTNPSLGPYEKITTVSLVISKEHILKVNEFINSSKVNNTVTLKEYLEAVNKQDTQTLDLVSDNAPKGRLNEGSNISHLSFYLEGGQTITLSDVYRRFSVTHFYPDFTSYMVKEGTINHETPNAKYPIELDEMPTPLDNRTKTKN